MSAVAIADVPRGTVEPDSRIHSLPVDLVSIGPNVRVNVTAIDELAASIAEQGVLQPIKVRHATGGAGYEVVWGQRRLLATRIAGLTEIPALIDDAARTASELALEQLAENLSREDLNPIDRARAMKAVVDAGVSQADLARKLGIAPATVSNDIRLLSLDETVIEKVMAGAISAAHGKAIAALPPKQQREIAGRAVKDKWSAHRLEGEIEWRHADATRDERKAEKTAKWIPKAIAALEAAGVPKGTSVSIRGDTWSMDPDAVLAAVTKAGWKADREYRYGRPASCDCAAVYLEVGGRKAEVKPVCIDQRHEAQQRNLDRTADDARRAEQAKRLKVLRKHVRAALADLPLPILLLAQGETWQLPSLVANAPGLTRNAILESTTEAMVRRVDASTVWNDRQKEVAKALESLIAMFETPA